jgi:hypothetical protein
MSPPFLLHLPQLYRVGGRLSTPPLDTGRVQGGWLQRQLCLPDLSTLARPCPHTPGAVECRGCTELPKSGCCCKPVTSHPPTLERRMAGSKQPRQSRCGSWSVEGWWELRVRVLSRPHTIVTPAHRRRRMDQWVEEPHGSYQRVHFGHGRRQRAGQRHGCGTKRGHRKPPRRL